MKYIKCLAIMLVLVWASFCSASASEARAGDPQGIIFSAEQIKGQKFVTAPGPYWTPSQEQIDKLEKKLPAYLKDQAMSHSKPLKIDLSKYKRQYFGYSLNGKKVIYINAFSHSFDNWKNTLVFVFDGGQSFFQATFDPEANKFVSFSVNGDA